MNMSEYLPTPGRRNDLETSTPITHCDHCGGEFNTANPAHLMTEEGQYVYVHSPCWYERNQGRALYDTGSRWVRDSHGIWRKVEGGLD